MRQKTLTAFIPNLLFGLALAQPRPTFAATSVIGEFFVPVLPQTQVYIPIIYYSGPSDRPEPGFYHQPILLQKATDNYQTLITIEYEIDEDEGYVYPDNLQY